MMRTFCDLCDKEIAEDSSQYQLLGSESRPDGGYSKTELQLAGKWFPKGFSHTQICTVCYSRIRALILELAGELK